MASSAKASANTMPAGTIKPKSSLEDGEINITILSLESDGGRDTEKEVIVQDLDTGEPVIDPATGKPKTELMPPTEHGERFYVRCEHPGEFFKTYQVKTTADLIPQLVNQLRGHYGVESVKTLKAPDLAVGAVIVMEVANG